MEDNGVDFYTVKVRIRTEDDNGKVKNINTTYLVEAMSCTEAEAIVNSDFKNPAVDFAVVGISKTKIEKVLYIDDFKKNQSKPMSMTADL